MLKKFAVSSVLVVSLLVGASACSASDVKQSKFESELKKKTELTDTQAKCVTDKLYKDFKQSDINKIYTADNEKDLPSGMADKFTKLVTDCVTG